MERRCSDRLQMALQGIQGTSAGGREAGSMRRQEISRDVDFGARVRRHERVHKNMMMHG